MKADVKRLPAFPVSVERDSTARGLLVDMPGVPRSEECGESALYSEGMGPTLWFQGWLRGTRIFRRERSDLFCR